MRFQNAILSRPLQTNMKEKLQTNANRASRAITICEKDTLLFVTLRSRACARRIDSATIKTLSAITIPKIVASFKIKSHYPNLLFLPIFRQ